VHPGRSLRELVQLQEPLDKSPDQNESLNQVKGLIQEHLANLRVLVDTRRSNGFEGVKARMAKGEGRDPDEQDPQFDPHDAITGGVES
jgi:CHASE3 domain sensor protein